MHCQPWRPSLAGRTWPASCGLAALSRPPASLFRPIHGFSPFDAMIPFEPRWYCSTPVSRPVHSTALPSLRCSALASRSALSRASRRCYSAHPWPFGLRAMLRIVLPDCPWQSESRPVHSTALPSLRCSALASGPRLASCRAELAPLLWLGFSTRSKGSGSKLRSTIARAAEQFPLYTSVRAAGSFRSTPALEQRAAPLCKGPLKLRAAGLWHARRLVGSSAPDRWP